MKRQKISTERHPMSTTGIEQAATEATESTEEEGDEGEEMPEHAVVETPSSSSVSKAISSSQPASRMAMAAVLDILRKVIF